MGRRPGTNGEGGLGTLGYEMFGYDPVELDDVGWGFGCTAVDEEPKVPKVEGAVRKDPNPVEIAPLGGLRGG